MYGGPGRPASMAWWVEGGRAVPLSVLLVDDNPTFLRILMRFLSEQSEVALRVVGSVAGGRDAMAQVRQLQPEIILLDLQMPDVSGLELLPQFRATLPDSVIIALTLMDPDTFRDATLAAGADGFVSKASLERDLIPAIRRLASLEQTRRSPSLRPEDRY